jgi:hypothetical protein
VTTDSEAPGLELSGADPEVAQVIRAILPIFNNERERPERVGTCVLLRLHDHAFVVTAAHVIDDIKRSTGRFTVAIGGKLITIHRARFVTQPQDTADIGLVPLRPPSSMRFSRVVACSWMETQSTRTKRPTVRMSADDYARRDFQSD